MEESRAYDRMAPWRKLAPPLMLAALMLGLVGLLSLRDTGSGSSWRLPTFSKPESPQAGSCATDQWPGWDKMKYLFVFGDSYTQTGFNATIEPVPSPSNPMGNPEWPGWTSCNGPNWIDLLTVTHNASLLLTYDMAVGGATVGQDLVPPLSLTVPPLTKQVHNIFLPAFVSEPRTAPSAPDWKGDDSLFLIWIGINDVALYGYGLSRDRKEHMMQDVMIVYSAVLWTLVTAGARNIVLMNVPPLERAPWNTSRGKKQIDKQKEDVLAFNAGVERMAANLRKEFANEGVNAWILDTYELFGKVMDDPTVYEETESYKNVTWYCEPYQYDTHKEVSAQDDGCENAVNEYLWHDALHPTYPVHNATARLLSESLAAGPNVC